jgi:hypothetical protein
MTFAHSLLTLADARSWLYRSKSFRIINPNIPQEFGKSVRMAQSRVSFLVEQDSVSPYALKSKENPGSPPPLLEFSFADPAVLQILNSHYNPTTVRGNPGTASS